MSENVHKIRAVSALPDSRSIRVSWSNGQESAIDLADFLNDFPIFAPLADDAARFAEVSVGEWGWEITWDDGGDLSIAATTLYRLAAEQSADPARQFGAWMARQGFTPAAAGEALGLARRTVLSYRAGKKPVLKVVQLACRAIEMERAGRFPG